jgi:carboxymethylenebutenolidase
VTLPTTRALLTAGTLLAFFPNLFAYTDIATAPLPGTQVTLSKAKPPESMEATAVEWISITSPKLDVMLAAVAKPSGTGPFKTVVILHGSHGFAREYVQLATALADQGIQAIAACWFSGSGGGAGSRFVSPIACPEAPPMPVASSEQALATIDTLIQAARQLPGARDDRIALFGHSRGGGAALNYILKRSGIYAVALNSAGYPPEFTAAAARVQAPVLILHGTADGPLDGGSAMTSVAMARNFEAATRRAGKPLDTHYYDGAGHSGIFTSEAQRADTLQRIVRFLEQPIPEASSAIPPNNSLERTRAE